MRAPLAPTALGGLLELARRRRPFVGVLIDGYLSESPDLLEVLPTGSGDELIRAAHRCHSPWWFRRRFASQRGRRGPIWGPN